MPAQEEIAFEEILFSGVTFSATGNTIETFDLQFSPIDSKRDYISLSSLSIGPNICCCH
jgi:hypothetical protein